MIKLNEDRIRVRCMECKEEHFIELKEIGVEKAQRSLGYEYEHIYRGEKICGHCYEKMEILLTVFEYPKTIVNYIDEGYKGCIIMDKITSVDDTVMLNVLDERLKPGRSF